MRITPLSAWTSRFRSLHGGMSLSHVAWQMASIPSRKIHWSAVGSLKLHGAHMPNVNPQLTTALCLKQVQETLPLVPMFIFKSGPQGRTQARVSLGGVHYTAVPRPERVIFPNATSQWISIVVIIAGCVLHQSLLAEDRILPFDAIAPLVRTIVNVLSSFGNSVHSMDNGTLTSCNKFTRH